MAAPQPPVGFVGRAEALNVIGSENLAGAIWQRQIPEEFQDWVNGLAPQNLPSARAILPPCETRAVVNEVCEASNTPKGANLDWFKEDVCLLAQTFSRILSAPYLLLRFDVVADNACRKFHTDMVRARMICTYRGRGTQYGVPQGGEDPQHIYNVRTGDPILLRGKRWPAQNAGELRHRSPPIAGTGETRLILVLDSVTSLDDRHATQVSQPKRRLAESKTDAMPRSTGELV